MFVGAGSERREEKREEGMEAVCRVFSPKPFRGLALSQKNTWKNFCFFCVRGEGKRIDLDRTNTPEVVAKGSLDRITAALREEKLRGAATEAKLEAASPSTATSEEKKKKTPQKKKLLSVLTHLVGRQR